MASFLKHFVHKAWKKLQTKEKPSVIHRNRAARCQQLELTQQAQFGPSLAFLLGPDGANFGHLMRDIGMARNGATRKTSGILESEDHGEFLCFWSGAFETSIARMGF
jgi:hypothetical protein